MCLQSHNLPVLWQRFYFPNFLTDAGGEVEGRRLLGKGRRLEQEQKEGEEGNVEEVSQC